PQFKSYHERYYHPSNARFYFYGDDDPQERLRFIDAFIAEFDGIAVEPSAPPQPRFDEPRRITRSYAVSEEDEGEDNKGMVTMTWLLNETTDAERGLAYSILDYILVDTP